MPTKIKADLEAQERVVTALWRFARRVQTEQPTCESGDGTKLPIVAVEEALNSIMASFGYRVLEIQ